MTGADFYFTVALIAMSFVGFAGLMDVLRRQAESWTPLELFQLRIIVAYAIATLFGSLSTIPVVELFGLFNGIRLLSFAMLLVAVALGVIYLLHDIRKRHGTVISTRMRATFTALMLFGLMVQLGAVLTGVPTLYQLGLILMLAMPAGTYAYVVARLGR